MIDATPLTTEICAYCLTWEPDAPARCRSNRRSSAHRFEPIEMDPRVLEVVADFAPSGLLSGPAFELGDTTPNFWHGIDYACARLCPDDWGEGLKLYVFDGGAAKGLLRYRVDFDAETPIAIVTAALRAALEEAEMVEEMDR